MNDINFKEAIEYELRAASYGTRVPYSHVTYGVQVLTEDIRVADDEIILACIICTLGLESYDKRREPVENAYGNRVKQIISEFSRCLFRDDWRSSKKEELRRQIEHYRIISKDASNVVMVAITTDVRCQKDSFCSVDDVGYFLWCRKCLENMQTADAQYKKKLIDSIDNYVDGERTSPLDDESRARLLEAYLQSPEAEKNE